VIFTTRPDTLWGATFMVLAPEHPLVEARSSAAGAGAPQWRPIQEEQAARQDEISPHRQADKEKSGVFSGGYAINPVNDEQHPDLDRRLCADGLWHRRDHGSSGAR
jgi:leucyl-tRNA synthetase